MPKKKTQSKNRSVKPVKRPVKKKSSPKKKPVKQIRIRRKRAALRSKIYRRRMKQKKLKRAKDMTTYKKVGRQIMELKGNVKELNKKLGIKQKAKPDLDKIKEQLQKASEKVSKEDRKSDYIEDTTPYTIWQGMQHVDKQIWSPRWDWIIVDGKRFSTKDAIRLEANIADAFSAFDSDDVITISYNPKTKTLRYELF